MVGNSAVYPHPIGGTREAGDGSCCAGCQERCCWTTTHRGGDVRRLASDSEEVGSWQKSYDDSLYDDEQDELSEPPDSDEDGDELSHLDDESGADDEDSLERDLDDRSVVNDKGSLESDSVSQAGVNNDGAEPTEVAELPEGGGAEGEAEDEEDQKAERPVPLLEQPLAVEGPRKWLLATTCTRRNYANALDPRPC